MLPPFLQDAVYWARMTGGHFLLMFWWIWLAAAGLTALAESGLGSALRRRLVAGSREGRSTLLVAVALGVLSPPSRRRIFGEARGLLADGLSGRSVTAYLVGAQSLVLWFLFSVVALNGPQPVIGQCVAVAALLAVVLAGMGGAPDRLWDEARLRARRVGDGPGGGAPGAFREGSVWLRPARSLLGQAWSLAWPLAFGALGAGFFLALGQSEAYVSLQGTRGPLVQGGNAVAGLLLGYVTGAPLAGNAFFAAGLWKAGFVTYAGLSAFYLATLVMPFALPRYFDLFGPELGKRLVRWLVVGILVGSLAATALWWGLDWIAGVAGVREWFEVFADSTLRPNDVPWFHHWFAPDI